MLSGRSLSGDEANRVRDGLRRVVADAGTQTAAAKALGMTQQTISDVLAGKAPGVALAMRVAKHLQTNLDELLAGKSEPHIEPDERYPERAKACAAAKIGGVDARAIEQVGSAEYDLAGDPGFKFWMDEIFRAADHLKFVATNSRAAARDAERSRAELESMPRPNPPKAGKSLPQTTSRTEAPPAPLKPSSKKK